MIHAKLQLMLLQRYPDIPETIVVVLAKSGGNLTVEEIHYQRQNEFGNCSLRVVYKHLKNLLEQGVVFKVKSRYSLHLSWLINLDNFASFAVQKNHNTPLNNIALPEECQKITWQFSNLEKLDNLWTHLGLNLARTLQWDKYYLWHPHPWFHVLSHNREIEYQTALANFPRKDYLIIGGTTFIDRFYLEYRHKYVITSMAKSKFHRLRDTHYSTHGPYLATVKIGKKLTQEIEDYFQRVKSKKDLDLREAREILTQKTNAKLILENNPKKLARLVKYFHEFFGIQKS